MAYRDLTLYNLHYSIVMSLHLRANTLNAGILQMLLAASRAPGVMLHTSRPAAYRGIEVVP
jgi:hypothetical protein